MFDVEVAWTDLRTFPRGSFGCRIRCLGSKWRDMTSRGKQLQRQTNRKPNKNTEQILCCCFVVWCFAVLFVMCVFAVFVVFVCFSYDLFAFIVTVSLVTYEFTRNRHIALNHICSHARSFFLGVVIKQWIPYETFLGPPGVRSGPSEQAPLKSPEKMLGTADQPIDTWHTLQIG